jgi:hypothetical protein
MVQLILLCLVVLNNSPLDIDLWLDREDAIYHPTENLEIFFQTSHACYVSVYNIESGGRITRLFPPEGASGWVEASRIYKLPSEDADYDYVIEGPEGIETIIILASNQRLPKFNDAGPDIVSKTIEVYIHEPDPGRLKIVTTPPQCRIYITDMESGDEDYVGKAPQTIYLRPGEYIVEIKKTGFKTLTRKIWIEPGENRRVKVQLLPVWY